MDLEFDERVRTCEKRLTGKQPLLRKRRREVTLPYMPGNELTSS